MGRLRCWWRRKTKWGMRKTFAYQLWDGHTWAFHEDVAFENLICLVCGKIGPTSGDGLLLVDDEGESAYAVPCVHSCEEDD